MLSIDIFGLSTQSKSSRKL